MTFHEPGEGLFRALREDAIPAFDHGAGRARFLERFAARRKPSRRRWALLAAAAAVVCAIAIGAWRATSEVTFSTAAGEGRAGTWLASGGTTDLPLIFSEGTRVVMAPGSRGRVDALRRSGASFLLERGRVSARVMHRTNADWRFLAGPFEVRVTGTRLGVDWDPAQERFAVRVEEGSVEVRGPNVGEPQVVREGEQCVVDVPRRTARLGPSDREGVPEADALADGGAAPPSGEKPEPYPRGASTLPAPLLAPGRPAASGSTWGRLEEKGDYDGAYAVATSVGLASILRSSSADELLRLAQVARLSGHRDTERDALVTCRRRFPGSERAAVAAYELGQSSSPGEAASWFDTYLGEQPSGALAREAAGRLIESRAAAGDDRGARDAAARYLARYPGGPHAPLARRVLTGAHE
ncbi:MAG TPA: hypothetical protein VKU41_19135 [Polyangiaceae bacterium]|nr:hypothetical protein [Polyangiaceae bacterium]